MATRNQTLKAQGYNTRALRKLKIKQWTRKGLLLFLCLTVSAFFVFRTFEYFANIPRERKQAGFSYFQRVQHGMKMTWMALIASSSTLENHPKESELPSITAFVHGNYLDVLNESLPESGQRYVPAEVKINGKLYDAKMRYRGDSINHWAFPQKSWRVKLTKGKFYQGIQYFNLYQPRTQNQLSEQLSYEMADRMGGLLTPRTFYTHFRLNRRFNGIRMFLEQVNENFPVLRGLLPGDILQGDIDTADIYNVSVAERKKLFGLNDASNWKVIGLDVDRGTADNEAVVHPKMVSILRVLNNYNDPYELRTQIPLHINVESTLRYMALLEIVGSSHIDGTHNHKWYLDPADGTISPIVWDPLAYLWGNRPGIDLDSNLLFRKMLMVPEFRHRKNEIIWEVIHGALEASELQEYIDETANLLRKDVYDNPLKIRATREKLAFNSNDDWEVAVENIRKVIKERNNKLRGYLTRADGEFSWEVLDDNTMEITVQTAAHSGFVLKSFSFPKALEKATIKRKKGKTWISNSIRSSQEGVLAIDDHLHSSRVPRNGRGRISAVPGIYTYRIVAEDIKALGAPRLEALHPFTKSSITLKHTQEARIDGVEGIWNLERVHIKSTILEGAITLSEDLFIGIGERLEIRPGTTLTMAPGTGIYVHGAPVHIMGTTQAPVTITAQDKHRPFKSIGISSSPEVKISHLRVLNGTMASTRNAFFPAALSLHHSKVNLSNVSLKHSELSVRFSTGHAKEIHIESRGGKPLYKKGSGVVFEPKVINEMGSRTLSTEILNQTPAGSPPRIEREFKFTIEATAPVKVIAAKAAKALKESFEDTSKVQWKAPSIAESGYWLTTSTNESIYRDVYFDTVDKIALKHDISYRLRHRFSEMKNHHNHLKAPTKPRFFPYRAEFQAKTGRVELGNGFSTVDEARFEFRAQSKPFDFNENKPPPPPWPVLDYIPWMQTGYYKGYATYPGWHLAKALKGHYPSRAEYEFVPVAVLLSSRHRHHLNIKTPYGSGPNPSQSFIITFDEAFVYSVDDYLSLVKTAPIVKGKLKLEPLGRILETEIEFERNVSERLDLELSENPDNVEAQKAKAAFLEDQKHIVEVLSSALENDKIRFTSARGSKFTQAVALIEGAD